MEGYGRSSRPTANKATAEKWRTNAYGEGDRQENKETPRNNVKRPGSLSLHPLHKIAIEAIQTVADRLNLIAHHRLPFPLSRARSSVHFRLSIPRYPLARLSPN
ncbi:hypothetical protein QQ045_026149 [Rhodiola kirilowii]